jgi:regulator of replication initiation timing
LKQENERIGKLLEQIDVIKEKEEMEKMMLNEKEALNHELDGLRQMLSEKEKEMITFSKKQTLPVK